MAIVEGILVGIFGNLATDVIKKGITAWFCEKSDPLIPKVYDAIDRVAKIFFDEYKNQFGKPEDSFLARQENWDAFFNELRFDLPSISISGINPEGFKGASQATEEAIEYFLTTLKEEMEKDFDLSQLLAQKEHIHEGKEILHGVKKLVHDVKKIQSKNGSGILPKALTNKIPRTSRNEIVGRENDLASLHKKLFDNKHVVLVNGMGGIGKTTLAQVYIDTFWDEYRHIAWVSQLAGDIPNSFINCEGLLDNLSISKEGKKSDELFQEIISSINRITDTPNLLVVDNAESSLSEYFDYLPRQLDWHILVTSRNEIERFDIQKIGFLSVNEAVELFLKHYTLGKISPDKIEHLLQLVELHTLTIEILAKSAQLQRFDIEKLEHAIETDLKANVHIAHSGKKIERITSYLCSIFRMDGLSENEIWLLKQFACLPTEFIDYDIVKFLVCPEESEKKDVLSETIELLSSKGWLLKNGDSFKMHRIIADVVIKQNSITVDDVAELLASITIILSIDDTKDNPVDKFPFIPYGESFLSVFPDSEHENISILQNNLALRLQDLGNYTGAKVLLEKAVMSNEKNFGNEHSSTAISYSNLALVLKDLGDYTGAKVLLEKTVISDEKNFGTEHPSTAISYSNLALVLKNLRDYTGAKVLLEKTVISDEKNFGTEHPSTARSYSNLALVLKNLGDYTGAKKLLEKAMISDEKNFGAEHPNTATIYSNLALVLKDLGDYTGAKVLLEKAVISNEKNFSPEHPSTAISYSNLASVLQDLGDYTEALALSEKSVKIFKSTLPEGHPNIQTVIEIRDSIKQCINSQGAQ